MTNQVTVSIPATTANLGPGFDCLGMALTLRNQINFIALETPGALQVTVRGEGQSKIPTDETNLVIRAAETLFARVGRRPAGLAVVQENNVPVGSGLGSSSAAALGGLLAANALVGGHLSRSELLMLATEIEGHPDNVAPALHGGLTLINQFAGGLHIESIPVPPLQVVIVLPDFDLPTAEARAALPAQVPLADAIFNAGRMGLLVRALAAGDYERLALAMDDRLHQPYRLPLIPGMTAAFTAAKEVGAAAVALSGAGPSVVAFAGQGHKEIAGAIEHAFRSAGLASRHWLLAVDTDGARVEAPRQTEG